MQRDIYCLICRVWVAGDQAGAHERSHARPWRSPDFARLTLDVVAGPVTDAAYDAGLAGAYRESLARDEQRLGSGPAGTVAARILRRIGADA